MPNYWPGQQQWPGSSSCSVWECCRSVAASWNVAAAGSGALQRTGALQRPGMLQGQDQERCNVQERCSVGNVARPNMTKWSPSRSTWQNPNKIDQTYRAPGPPAGMPNYWPRQQQWPGSRSCSVRECCRSRIRSVAAYRSVTGVLQGQDQERCSVQERYRSVAGAGSGALQGSVTWIGYQVCCRGRICYVTGTLRELVW
jgi:hypothetical protein